MFVIYGQKKILVYLCSGLILVGFLIAWIIKVNVSIQGKKILLADPQAGDVYLVHDNKNKQSSYYFLKVADIWGDSVIVYHSSLEYSGYVSQLNNDDYFVQDEQVIYTKNELQQMLEKNEINNIDRGSDTSKGFERIK